ncbi:Hypothetical predicted protein [Cloeon dipterum]|uniref:Gustatory receptor n=1 Tax=Cloeon dipterum TaxID=197152 RepID=A0A8S1BKB2_9INSE|nr:Hypothetical predicted protein [Cloeon dipterum]
MGPLYVEGLFALTCLKTCECLDQISSSTVEIGESKHLSAKFCEICEIVWKINRRFGLDFLISMSLAPLLLISCLLVLVCSFLNIGSYGELNLFFYTSYAVSSFVRTSYVCYFCRKLLVKHFEYDGTLEELIEYLGIDWCSMIPLCIESIFGIFCFYVCECLDQICVSPCKDNKLLLRVFVHLCATVQKINERFGVDFLISIAIGRITLLSSLFTLICSLLGLGNYESLNPIYLCSYATSSFARIYFVCYFCRKVILKIEETKLELFNRCVSARQQRNEPLPLAIKCVMNRKKIAAFDACGFIQISMDLLGEIIGSVITYLVVLVQFQFLKK